MGLEKLQPDKEDSEDDEDGIGAFEPETPEDIEQQRRRTELRAEHERLKALDEETTRELLEWRAKSDQMKAQVALMKKAKDDRDKKAKDERDKSGEGGSAGGHGISVA